VGAATIGAVPTTRQVLLRVAGALAGKQPRDEALRWRGLAQDGAPVVRIAHYGDCGWREMPLSHGVHTPPGYPRALAGQLAAQGYATEFSAVVAHQFEHLPREGELEMHLKLTGEPDVVLVQLGVLYSRWVVLPDTPETLRLRGRISRTLGRRVFLGYRLLLPLVWRFGGFNLPYEGTHELEGFLGLVRERWPAAHVIVLLPFERALGATEQKALVQRIRNDVGAVAARAGVEVIDPAPAVPADVPGLRCANGYNLNARGSALVGDLIAARIAERLSSRAPA
jgi:hypothetical protein